MLNEVSAFPAASAIIIRDDPFEVLMICGMAMGLSFLATLYPSYRAAGTDPVQVLRYE